MTGQTGPLAIGTPLERSRLVGLRRYLVFTALASLVWQVAHLPLCTIWLTGTLYDVAFAVLHSTGGGILIALSTLTLALVPVGSSGWPADRCRADADAAMGRDPRCGQPIGPSRANTTIWVPE